MTWLDWLLRRSDLLSDAQADLAHMRVFLTTDVISRLHRMERLIMTSADNLAARIDAATNEVAADLTAVRDALAAALANADAATQDAVNAELAKLAGPIARLEALGPAPLPPAGPPHPTAT